MGDGESRLTFMRSTKLGFFIVGTLLAVSSSARAQDALPPPSANTGSTSGLPGEVAPSGPPGPPTVEALPPPQAGGGGAAEAAAAAGGAAPAAAAAPKGPLPSDWQFSWHGYFRAPLRIGVGHRDACPPNMLPSTSASGAVYNGPYCAAPGQSHTTFHTPY